MDRVPTPVSARFAGVGDRARALRLRASQMQIRPTDLPDLRVVSPGQSLDKSQISYPIPMSASSTSSNSQSINLPKRRVPHGRTAQLLREEYQIDSAVDIMPNTLHHRRAVTAGDIRPVTQFIHRRTVSDETVMHLSPSIGVPPQRHSIARKPVACQANFLSNVAIPDSITEVDSPPKASRQNDQNHSGARVPPSGLNLLGLELPSCSSVTPVPGAPVKANLHKELPDLPSYLIPSPLFSHTVIPDPKLANPSTFVLDWSFQQSRFSAWTALSEEDDDDDESDTDTDGQDGLSSTFSDIQDSGHPSPLRISSDPFWTSPFDDNIFKSQKMAIEPSTEECTLGSREQTPIAGAQGQSKKEMTPMEELMHEFEFIGAALI
jgi:hypothetical protein